MFGRTRLWGVAAGTALAMAFLLPDARAAEPVTLVQDGEPRMKIIAGSVTGPEEMDRNMEWSEPVIHPVNTLRDVIQRMSGATLEIEPAREGAQGIYVGLLSDFPWLNLEGTGDLGPEGFIIRSDGTNLFLLAEGELGVQHAVSSFLFHIGCRWFFPGETWTVIPETPTIAGGWDDRQQPDFSTYRHMGTGSGLYPRQRDEGFTWRAFNRWGGPDHIRTGHTWYGIDRDTYFEQRPEWFALVEQDDGTMQRRRNKPCYSHPEVIEHIINHARARAASGEQRISLSPPDGLNYCECDRCKQVFQGGEPFRAHLTMFAERPDGVLVNITSENLYAMMNRVAEALEEDYPDVLIASHGYSAYSHPPSFEMHPNIYINVTTRFRRTPWPLEEQLQAWGRATQRLGIRDYWSVYQWDWDNPNPNQMRPHVLQENLRMYHANNARTFMTETSNNWGPRGLGYYIGSHLLWDVDADINVLIADFYEKSFGPAAEAMQRYYELWYGPEVVVLSGSSARPGIEERVWNRRNPADSRQALRQAFEHLDEAHAIVADLPGHRERVDHLRMYMVNMHFRLGEWEATETGDPEKILNAIRDELTFAGRLAWTNMVHVRALMNKRYRRLYSQHEALWEDLPEMQDRDGWRQVREVPTREELEVYWANAKADLGLN